MTTSELSERARRLAFVLAIMTVLGTLIVAVRPVAAFPPSITVNVGQYTGTYRYVPNEVITFTISSNTAGEIYDVAAYVLQGATRVPLSTWHNVTIPASLSITYTWTVPSNLSDGGNYYIGVRDQNWIANGLVLGPYDTQNFSVQGYTFRIETDRPAYVGGDTVTVTWSANEIKDGSLAPAGYGQMWARNASGWSLITPSPYVFPSGASSGSYSFKLADLADARFDGTIIAWFNDTASTPTARFQRATSNFFIDQLGAIVNVAAPRNFAPGGIVTAAVSTVATDNPGNPVINHGTEPGMNVDMSVWQLPATGPAVQLTQYGATGLVTDAHGALTYVFKLDSNAVVGNYRVNATARHPNGIWTAADTDTFTVTTSAALRQVLHFDRTQYMAGDDVHVTSIVSGTNSTTITYIFEVRDTTGGGSCAGGGGLLLARVTQSTNTYTYAIGNNFAGTLCFRVTANTGTATVLTTQTLTVVFGYLLVNSNVPQYNAGETVTISWLLVSNAIQNPTYYYAVTDSGGNLVASGTTNQGTSFPFPVPSSPSTTYRFTITATEDGRYLQNALTLNQVTGFFITLTFDASSYAPGDTMKVRYAISARSSASILPRTFVITYGLASAPGRVLSTDKTSGTLTYPVPKGIDQGTLLFGATESNTGASTTQAVTIRGTSPLWFVTAGDIPLIVLIMLVWLILMTLLLWRRGALGGMGPRAAPKEPAAPAKQEPVHAPPTSPMTVTCRSCGSPIEITTSKRPIEVMCPKCGNTEVVS